MLQSVNTLVRKEKCRTERESERREKKKKRKKKRKRTQERERAQRANVVTDAGAEVDALKTRCGTKMSRENRRDTHNVEKGPMGRISYERKRRRLAGSYGKVTNETFQDSTGRYLREGTPRGKDPTGRHPAKREGFARDPIGSAEFAILDLRVATRFYRSDECKVSSVEQRGAGRLTRARTPGH